MALTESLEVQSNAFDDTIGRLDVLLQDKLLQISELSECFQSKDATPEDSRIHSKVMVESQDLLQESFRVGKDDGNVSDDSFEDLRN